MSEDKEIMSETISSSSPIELVDDKKPILDIQKIDKYSLRLI